MVGFDRPWPDRFHLDIQARCVELVWKRRCAGRRSVQRRCSRPWGVAVIRTRRAPVAPVAERGSAAARPRDKADTGAARRSAPEARAARARRAAEAPRAATRAPLAWVAPRPPRA